jgi:hypothetical protein
MANIAKEASIRMFTYPLRILIIINSIILPILLGIIVYFIFKFKKPVENIINKAVGIEKIIEDNIHIGLSIIYSFFDNIQSFTDPDKINDFIMHAFLPSVSRKLFHYIHDHSPNILKTLNEGSIDSFMNNLITQIQTDDYLMNKIYDLFKNLTHFDLANLGTKDILNELKEHILTSLNDTFTSITKEQFNPIVNQFIKENFTFVNLLTYAFLPMFGLFGHQLFSLGESGTYRGPVREKPVDVQPAQDPNPVSKAQANTKPGGDELPTYNWREGLFEGTKAPQGQMVRGWRGDIDVENPDIIINTLDFCDNEGLFATIDDNTPVGLQGGPGEALTKSEYCQQYVPANTKAGGDEPPTYTWLNTSSEGSNVPHVEEMVRGWRGDTVGVGVGDIIINKSSEFCDNEGLFATIDDNTLVGLQGGPGGGLTKSEYCQHWQGQGQKAGMDEHPCWDYDDTTQEECENNDENLECTYDADYGFCNPSEEVEAGQPVDVYEWQVNETGDQLDLYNFELDDTSWASLTKSEFCATDDISEDVNIFNKDGHVISSSFQFPDGKLGEIPMTKKIFCDERDGP